MFIPVHVSRAGSFTLSCHSVPLMSTVPPFQFHANGTPTDWNDPKATLHRGKRTKWIVLKAQPQHVTVPEDRLLESYQSLRVRDYANGRPITRQLAPPQNKYRQWYTLHWIPFGGPQKGRQCEKDGWVRAWHGAIMEALFATMFNG